MKRSFSQNGYYHIYNRGIAKQNIFLDKKDYIRFLFLILSSQGEHTIPKISRQCGKYRVLDICNSLDKHRDDIQETRYVELLDFCIMPNHFHMTVHELKDGGISKYMHTVLNSYSKYFNRKYNKNGHVFQGPYKCKHILDDQQNFYLSAYIHNNPKELQKWKTNPEEYPWSSYQDYTSHNRWGNLLSTELILDAHQDGTDYQKFVNSSGAKDNILQEII